MWYQQLFVVVIVGTVCHAMTRTRDDTSCTLMVKQDQSIVYAIESGTGCDSYSVTYNNQTEVISCNGDGLSRTDDGSDKGNRGRKLGHLIGRKRDRRMAGSTGKDRNGEPDDGGDTGSKTNNGKGKKTGKSKIKNLRIKRQVTEPWPSFTTGPTNPSTIPPTTITPLPVTVGPTTNTPLPVTFRPTTPGPATTPPADAERYMFDLDACACVAVAHTSCPADLQ